MSLYELLVAAHVICAVAWVGSSSFVGIYVARTERRGDATSWETFLGDISWAAPRFFIPISVLTMIFGGAAVAEGDLSFGDNPWLFSGLIMFVISFLIGSAFLGPQTDKALEELRAASGTMTDALRQRVQKVKLAHRFELVLLYAIVFLMVTKPT